MKRQAGYLTDTQLECLVREIELQEMVMAPPDLQEQILEAVEQKMQYRQDKAVEYRRFRFQVLTTVAAAVLAVFLLPRAEVLRQERTEQRKIELRLETLLKSCYENREISGNEGGVMENILGDVTIFADNNRWNLFKE